MADAGWTRRSKWSIFMYLAEQGLTCESVRLTTRHATLPIEKLRRSLSRQAELATSLECFKVNLAIRSVQGRNADSSMYIRAREHIEVVATCARTTELRTANHQYSSTVRRVGRSPGLPLRMVCTPLPPERCMPQRYPRKPSRPPRRSNDVLRVYLEVRAAEHNRQSGHYAESACGRRRGLRSVVGVVLAAAPL